MAAIMAQPFNTGNMHYFPTEQQETSFNDPFNSTSYPTDTQSYGYSTVAPYRHSFQQPSLPRYSVSVPLQQQQKPHAFEVSPTTAANPYSAYWPPTPPLQSNLSPTFYGGPVQPISQTSSAPLLGSAPVRTYGHDSGAGLGLSFGDGHPSRNQSFASIGSSNATFRTQCSDLDHSHSDASRASSPTTSDLTQFGYLNAAGTWTCNYPGCQSKAVFTRGCDLRKHHKRHTKTFFCSYPGCQQQQSGGFSSKKDLARHEAKHNPGVTCEWDGCDRIFSRVDNMRDHVKRIHQRRQNRRVSRPTH